MPRGEKKTWQVEPKMERTKTRGGGEVSSLVVTSTSEEGRLDQVFLSASFYGCNHVYLQVLEASGAEYGKDNWERVWRGPRAPRYQNFACQVNIALSHPGHLLENLPRLSGDMHMESQGRVVLLNLCFILALYSAICWCQ